MMKAIPRMLRKPPRVWWMAIQTVFLSAKYRWEMLKVPFEKTSKRLGTLRYETPMGDVDVDAVREVSYVVNGICRRTPWESMCFVKARCAKYLLNKKGLPCTLYMGVNKDSDGNMIAHAWLRCGKYSVTGGREAVGCTVTGIFGDNN